MRISGLARNGCTITSWTWPYFLWAERMASSASTRSSGVSPIPIRMPVVKAIDNCPALSMVRMRRDGTLSGAFQCAPPTRSSRGLALSSINPTLTLVSRRRRRSSAPITPGLECGKSPVFSRTSSLIAARYSSVRSYPSFFRNSLASGNTRSGWSPRLNKASLHPALRPASATARTSSGSM